jgi:4-amino-4-deoxy-L-arabinose transferase-like glycosyltransferase
LTKAIEKLRKGIAAAKRTLLEWCEMSEDGRRAQSYLHQGTLPERSLAIILVIVFAAIFLFCAISSVHFGTHWDESGIITHVQKMLTSGILLPGYYNYPSLSYYIGLLTTLAHAPDTFGAADTVATMQLQLAEIAGSSAFKHQLRTVFAVLTASTALFVILAARAAGTGWLAATVSGAIVLSSFQVFYHSRWIAPDCLVMLTAAMTIAGALWAIRNKRLVSLLLTAISAGLATAAKYPAGVLLLLPLFVATCASDVPSRAARVLIVFGATYLVVTPGTVLEPVQFVKDVFDSWDYYRRGGLYTYTVDPGLPHLGKIVDFLAFRLASPHEVISLLVLTATIVGAAAAWRRDWRVAVVLAVAPVVYIIYFATGRTLVIRNLLILVPFIAVLTAITVDTLASSFRSRATRAGIPVAVAALLALNWPTLLHATKSVRDFDPEGWRESLLAYITAHPNRRFAASPQVSALLASATTQSMLLHAPEDADTYLYFMREHIRAYGVGPGGVGCRGEPCSLPLASITNRRNTYTVIVGPDDIDLDYYPTWTGLPRIVSVDASTARLLTGLAFRSEGHASARD